MRLLAVLAFIGLGVFCQPAHAQLVMRNYNFDEMRLALREVGSEIQREDADEDGQRFLQAKSKSGLIYLAQGRVCDSKEPTQRCTGLKVTCSFTLKPGTDPAKAMEVANYEAVRTFIEEGQLKLARYMIFDGGITPANLKTNLNVFLDISDIVWGKLGNAGFLGE